MGNAPTPDQAASAKKHASPEQIAQYLQSFDNDVEAATAVAAGLLSMIVPLLRNVRRNPINDMREE